MLTELQRDTRDAKVAGVCAALSEHWRIDPLLVRTATVVLALTSGVGMVLYAAAWLWWPQPGEKPLIEHWITTSGTWTATRTRSTIVAACVIFALTLGWLFPLGWGTAGICALVWWFAIRPAQRSAESRVEGVWVPNQIAPFTGPPTPFTEAALRWQQRVAELSSGLPGPTPIVAYLAEPDPVGLYAPQARPPVDLVPRKSAAMRRLWLAASLVLVLVTGSLGLSQALGATITPGVYAINALAVVGLTLLASAWLSRRQVNAITVMAGLFALAGAGAVVVLSYFPALDQRTIYIVCATALIAIGAVGLILATRNKKTEG